VGEREMGGDPLNFGGRAAPWATVTLKNAVPGGIGGIGLSNDQCKGAVKTPWGRPPCLANCR
jgi:hypothetical protein